MYGIDTIENNGNNNKVSDNIFRSINLHEYKLHEE